MTVAVVGHSGRVTASAAPQLLPGGPVAHRQFTEAATLRQPTVRPRRGDATSLSSLRACVSNTIVVTMGRSYDVLSGRARADRPDGVPQRRIGADDRQGAVRAPRVGAARSPASPPGRAAHGHRSRSWRPPRARCPAPRGGVHRSAARWPHRAWPRRSGPSRGGPGWHAAASATSWRAGGFGRAGHRPSSNGVVGVGASEHGAESTEVVRCHCGRSWSHAGP